MQKTINAYIYLFFENFIHKYNVLWSYPLLPPLPISPGFTPHIPLKFMLFFQIYKFRSPVRVPCIHVGVGLSTEAWWPTGGHPWRRLAFHPSAVTYPLPEAPQPGVGPCEPFTHLCRDIDQFNIILVLWRHTQLLRVCGCGDESLNF